MSGVLQLRSFKRLRLWLGRGSWAVMDQGLFAMSNFALNVLLARWLLPADYGAFAVAYTIFLLLGTFYTAIVTEPMLVFGPGKYRGRVSDYLGVLLRGHWALTAVIGILFALVGLVFWLTTTSPLTPILFGLALASPFILFQWLMRRACYVRLEPRLAASAGALYMVLMLVGAYALYSYGWLGALSALGIMAVASAVSGVWLMLKLKVSHVPSQGQALVKESLQAHWNYGRWAIGTAVLIWIPGNIYYMLLPSWGGLEAAGALRAMMNLIMPILQFNGALGTVLLPTLVQARAKGNFIETVRFAAALFVTGSVIYGVIIVVFNQPVLHWLYNGRYDEYSSLIWVLGLLPITAGLVSVLGGALRALEQPNRVFSSYIFTTILALTIGLGALAILGIYGAAVGLALSSGATALAFTWHLAHHVPSDQRGEV